MKKIINSIIILKYIVKALKTPGYNKKFYPLEYVNNCSTLRTMYTDHHETIICDYDVYTGKKDGIYYNIITGYDKHKPTSYIKGYYKDGLKTGYWILTDHFVDNLVYYKATKYIHDKKVITRLFVNDKYRGYKTYDEYEQVKEQKYFD